MAEEINVEFRAPRRDGQIAARLARLAGDYRIVPGTVDWSDMLAVKGRASTRYEHAFAHRDGDMVAWGRLLLPPPGGFEAFLTHFMARDDAAGATRLLQALRDRAACCGARTLLGPMAPDVSAPRGVLISECAQPPALGLARNPLYVADLFERAGFEKAVDLFSFRILMRPDPRISRVAYEVRRRYPDLVLRHLNVDRLAAEMATIADIYNEAWSGHWGFAPLTHDGLMNAFEAMRPFVNPEWVLFVRDGAQDVAILVSVPNIVDPRRNEEGGPLSARGMLFGVRTGWQRKGIDLLLFEAATGLAVRDGVTESEIGWVLETNDRWLRQIENAYSDAILERRHYRVFQAGTGA